MELKLNVVSNPEIIGAIAKPTGFIPPIGHKCVDPDDDPKLKSRNWCFTLNNYTEFEIRTLKEAIERNKYRFICWGYEVSESGTPHLQGYLELHGAKTRASVSRDPGCGNMNLSRRYARSCKGKAVAYCAKEWGKIGWLKATKKRLKAANTDGDGNLNQANYDRDLEDTCNNLTEKILLDWMHKNTGVWLFIKDRDLAKLAKRNLYFFVGGDILYGWNPGKRSDIDIVKEAVKAGADIHTVADVANSYQAFQFGTKLISIRPLKKREPPGVFWICGKSGSWKSRTARELAMGSVWTNNNTLDWFDGYTGQETAIIDDFRNKQCKYEWLLRLTDIYPLSVPIKGGFTEWCPKLIIFTCCNEPQVEVMSEVNDIDNTQFLRRIHKVIRLPEKEIVKTQSVHATAFLERLNNLNIEGIIIEDAKPATGMVIPAL